MGIISSNTMSEIMSAVKRKATGYTVEENADEYALVDGALTLVKRRINTKDVPPDISAVKLLMELGGDDAPEMSEEELRREKLRLIRLLTEESNANSKVQGQAPMRNGVVQKQGELCDKNGARGH